jgi:hypothetical protein
MLEDLAVAAAEHPLIAGFLAGAALVYVVYSQL